VGWTASSVPGIWQYNPQTQKYQCDQIQALISPNVGLTISWMTGINDTGCLVGEASDSGGNLRGVLLLPVTINVMSYLNPAPGEPLASASAVCVGEPVTLTITGTNDIPGYNFVAGYNWQVPNAIKNFIVSSGSGPIMQLSSTDTTASSLKVYYPVVPQVGSSSAISTSETITVSCDLTLVTGGTCTVTGSLNLVAPYVQITGSAPGPLSVSNTTTSGTAVGALLDGCNADFFPYNPNGLDANSLGVSPPSGFTSGSAAWLQVITDTVNATANGVYGNVISYTFSNDHGFPYGHAYGATIMPGNTPYSVNDSPIWFADNPPQTELDRTFSGGMYYMWNSGIPQSIWVPLRAIGWGFQGQINWSTNAQKFNWAGNPTRSPVVIIVPPSEPKWYSTSNL
jgi:hypothetical protein